MLPCRARCALVEPLLKSARASGQNAVRNRAEALSETWWQGRQWAVTAYGLECRDVLPVFLAVAVPK